MKLTLALAGLSVFALIGCSAGSASPTPVPNDTQNNTGVQGKSVVDYYNQFLFQTVGSCDAPSVMSFALAEVDQAFDSPILRRIDDRTAITAGGKLYLHADGTYQFRYQEWKTYHLDESTVTSTIDSEGALISGTWALSGSRIEFANLGTGTAVTIHKGDAIEIRFGQFPPNRFLDGKSLTFILGHENEGPRGERADANCPQ